MLSKRILIQLSYEYINGDGIVMHISVCHHDVRNAESIVFDSLNITELFSAKLGKK